MKRNLIRPGIPAASSPLPRAADASSYGAMSYAALSQTAEERSASATQIIARLRPQIAKLEGVALFLQPAQDITVGGRISRGQYQYTLQDPSLGELNTWAPKMLEKFKTLPELADPRTIKHGPINDGQCGACHEVHGSDHTALLVKLNAGKLYQPRNQRPR